MRAYFFVNNWLSQIQRGIQVAHCAVEMARYYARHTGVGETRFLDFEEWADQHKTMIVLNGGGHADLNDLTGFLSQGPHDLPWGYFKEDRESLNGAVTCVGVVIPERIYEKARMVREGTLCNSKDELRDPRLEWEADLIDRLNSCSLA